MNDLFSFVVFHWFLSGLLGITLGLLLWQEWRSRLAGKIDLSPQELTDWVNTRHAIIVDVREPSEFATGHIAGSRLIPSGKLEQSLQQLPKKSTPIITVCAHGIRSTQCANKLKKLGYEKVFSLASGLQQWQAERFPLVKE
jgi:rhodanese-related sulfurtransferase